MVASSYVWPRSRYTERAARSSPSPACVHRSAGRHLGQDVQYVALPGTVAVGAGHHQGRLGGVVQVAAAPVVGVQRPRQPPHGVRPTQRVREMLRGKELLVFGGEPGQCRRLVRERLGLVAGNGSGDVDRRLVRVEQSFGRDRRVHVELHQPAQRLGAVLRRPPSRLFGRVPADQVVHPVAARFVLADHVAVLQLPQQGRAVAVGSAARLATAGTPMSPSRPPSARRPGRNPAGSRTAGRPGTARRCGAPSAARARSCRPRHSRRSRRSPPCRRHRPAPR